MPSLVTCILPACFTHVSSLSHSTLQVLFLLLAHTYHTLSSLAFTLTFSTHPYPLHSILPSPLTFTLTLSTHPLHSPSLSTHLHPHPLHSLSPSPEPLTFTLTLTLTLTLSFFLFPYRFLLYNTCTTCLRLV